MNSATKYIESSFRKEIKIDSMLLKVMENIRHKCLSEHHYNDDYFPELCHDCQESATVLISGRTVLH